MFLGLGLDYSHVKPAILSYLMLALVASASAQQATIEALQEGLEKANRRRSATVGPIAATPQQQETARRKLAASGFVLPANPTAADFEALVREI